MAVSVQNRPHFLLVSSTSAGFFIKLFGCIIWLSEQTYLQVNWFKMQIFLILVFQNCMEITEDSSDFLHYILYRYLIWLEFHKGHQLINAALNGELFHPASHGLDQYYNNSTFIGLDIPIDVRVKDAGLFRLGQTFFWSLFSEKQHFI